jgi:acyl-CoA dehydrogenase
MSEWEEKGDYPREIHEKAYKAGVLSIIFPEEYGGTPPKDFDAFHDLILIDEVILLIHKGLSVLIFFKKK